MPSVSAGRSHEPGTHAHGPLPCLVSRRNAAVVSASCGTPWPPTGYERGSRLLVALAVLGVLHEVICPNGFYIVQMRGFRPWVSARGVGGLGDHHALGLDFARGDALPPWLRAGRKARSDRATRRSFVQP